MLTMASQPQDSANRGNSFTGACRSIESGARFLRSRMRKAYCNECLRLIRFWSRRVQAADAEHWVHLHCWRDQLLFKALVAEQIRTARSAADERAAPSPNPEGTRHRDSNGSGPHNKSHGRQFSGTENEAESLVILTPSEELPGEVESHHGQINGNSNRGDLRQHLSVMMNRLAPYFGRMTPVRAPAPPRFCMLCGAVESEHNTGVCRSCGTSLRP